jgi:hypothetical protein
VDIQALFCGHLKAFWRAKTKKNQALETRGRVPGTTTAGPDGRSGGMREDIQALFRRVLKAFRGRIRMKIHGFGALPARPVRRA